MLMAGVGCVGEVERHAADLDRHKPRPLRAGLDPEDVDEEPRQLPLVLRPDDRVIEFGVVPESLGGRDAAQAR